MPGENCLTAVAVREALRRQGQFHTASLNTAIRLECMGLQSIGDAFEDSEQIQAIWLSTNRINQIEGLNKLASLRVLHLDSNCISSMSGLSPSLSSLDTLNLSRNRITSITNLRGLVKLSTLNLADNCIQAKHGLQGLLECPSLQVVDVQNNLLATADVLEVFAALPQLQALSLLGNTVRSELKPFRKSVLARLLSLVCLDGKSVSPLERRCAVAWLRGGSEAELAAREAYREELREKERRNRQALRRMLAVGRARREARETGIDIASRISEAIDTVIVHNGIAECSVCQLGYIDSNEKESRNCVALRCGHTFHRECVSRWLAQQFTCPYCRCAPLPEPPTPASLVESARAESSPGSSLPESSSVATVVADAGVRSGEFVPHVDEPPAEDVGRNNLDMNVQNVVETQFSSTCTERDSVGGCFAGVTQDDLHSCTNVAAHCSSGTDAVCSSDALDSGEVIGVVDSIDACTEGTSSSGEYEFVTSTQVESPRICDNVGIESGDNINDITGSAGQVGALPEESVSSIGCRDLMYGSDEQSKGSGAIAASVEEEGSDSSNSGDDPSQFSSTPSVRDESTEVAEGGEEKLLPAPIEWTSSRDSLLEVYVRSLLFDWVAISADLKSVWEGMDPPSSEECRQRWSILDAKAMSVDTSYFS